MPETPVIPFIPFKTITIIYETDTDETSVRWDHCSEDEALELLSFAMFLIENPDAPGVIDSTED